MTAKSIDTAAISWNRVTDSPNGSPAVSYQYLVKSGDQVVVDWTTTPYPAAVVPGLPPGTPIDVLVRAQDTTGNLSPPAEQHGSLPRFLPDGPDSETSAHAAAVEQFVTDYAPYVETDDGDGFFPISFYWVPKMSTIDGATPCIHNSDRCLRQLEMPLRGTQGTGDYIEYPAPNDRFKQQSLIDYTLRFFGGYKSETPQRSAAMGYYLVSNAAKDGSFVIQYWYFWTYNYYPSSLLGHHVLDADKHEGDLEHFDIAFSKAGQPKVVTMSRHAKSQYKSYGWGDLRLSYVGTHVTAFAAEGDHALYEKCNSGGGFQLYDGDGPILAWDHTCGHGGPMLAVGPHQVTAKLNNATSNWACWQGRLGNHGPAAPLRQSTAPGVAGLCPARAKAHSASAGPLDAPSQSDANPALACRSFEQPPDSAAGVVAAACDQQQLAASLSGTQPPALGWGLTSGASVDHDDGPPAVAFSDDPDLSDKLQLSAWHASRPEIYVSTVKRGVYAHVLFPARAMAPGDIVNVTTPGSGPWRLIDSRGDVVATADPQRQRLPVPPAPKGPRPPLPVRLRLRRGTHVSTLRWTVTGPTTRGVEFAVLVSPPGKSRLLTVALAHLHARGQRRFAIRLGNSGLIGRVIRVVASRGSRSRQSRPIRGLSRR